MVHHDLQKTVVGILLFGVSAITGDTLLISSLGGIGVNWTAEGVGGLWSAFAQKQSGNTPLAEAGKRAIRRAVAELKAEYHSRHGRQVDTRAFDLVRDCASSVAVVSPIATTISGALDVQQALADALTDLLHGHDDRQRATLESELLPRVARTFHDELIGDDQARGEYQNLLIKSLTVRFDTIQPHLAQLPLILDQLRDVKAFSQNLSDSLTTLIAQVEALREAIARLEQEKGTIHQKLYIDSAVARDGGSATVRNDRADSKRRPVPSSAVEVYEGSAIAEGAGSQALVENRDGPFTPDSSREPGRPPALVLTLQFTPTPNGASVRWQADEIGVYQSDFVTPYSGQNLVAVLHALEHQQHPAFALDQQDRECLRALKLLEDPIFLPPDLPHRVGRALYAALVREQGMVALSLSQNQARQTQRPLDLRLLMPPEAVELAALPWELLWPKQGPPLLLSAQPSLHCTRHLDLTGPLPIFIPRQRRPLRILALTPRVQRTLEDLATTQSQLGQLWHDLKARGIAEITEISPVRRSDLDRAMHLQPDIVQYTGHGWYAEGRGVLMLDPSTHGASADLVDADQVAVALRGARMVVLAACRGAQGPGIEGGTASLLTGVAPALSAAGVPLVVGMQLAVTVASIHHTTEAIYRALAEGHSAQSAVGRARDALYIAGQERSAWYVPVLYVSTREPGPVLL